MITFSKMIFIILIIFQFSMSFGMTRFEAIESSLSHKAYEAFGKDLTDQRKASGLSTDAAALFFMQHLGKMSEADKQLYVKQTWDNIHWLSKLLLEEQAKLTQARKTMKENGISYFLYSLTSPVIFIPIIGTQGLFYYLNSGTEYFRNRPTLIRSMLIVNCIYLASTLTLRYGGFEKVKLVEKEVEDHIQKIQKIQTYLTSEKELVLTLSQIFSVSLPSP